MKKTLLWGAIASIFFVSCSKNEIVDSIEPSGDFVALLAEASRTELDNTSVIWNAEDELTIFTKTEHNRQYKVKTLSEDGRTATFGFVDYTGTSNGTISANYAVYPYDAQATLSGDVISTVIASEQQYNAEKVDLSCALMAAKSESNSFAFVNAGALMRFNVSKSELIPDSYTLNSIKLSSAANNIAGDVTIDLSAESRAVVASTGTKQITLTAINQEITTEAKAFYVALPAVSFADKDLTVTFTFADGEKSFALPVFELEQGSIKTIAYTINDAEDFEGTTPDNGNDFEGTTPGDAQKPANNEIFYTNGSTTEATTPNNKNAFGVNIVSNTYDTQKSCWVIKFDGEVTSIGENAFLYDNITSIIIPESVTSIGKYAFSCCKDLTSVTIPNSVTKIGEFAFEQCIGITSFIIPEGVTEIGNNAFGNNENLTSVTIPSSVTSIGDTLFTRCTNLQEIIVSENNTKYDSRDKCNAIIESGHNNLVIGCPTTIIPKDIASIDKRAFFYCTGLKNINIPEDVASIGMECFEGCNALTSVTIGTLMKGIGSEAFNLCSSLETVYCLAINPPALGSSVFEGCKKLNSIYVLTSSQSSYRTKWMSYSSLIKGM